MLPSALTTSYPASEPFCDWEAAAPELGPAAALVFSLMVDEGVRRDLNEQRGIDAALPTPPKPNNRLRFRFSLKDPPRSLQSWTSQISWHRMPLNSKPSRGPIKSF